MSTTRDEAMKRVRVGAGRDGKSQDAGGREKTGENASVERPKSPVQDCQLEIALASLAGYPSA